MSKLSFIEWYKVEYEDECNPDLEEILSSLYQSIISDGTHHGDCTKENYTCELCFAESLLTEYYEYVFPEKIKK